MAVRQIDGGSSIINILHGMGHCTSHYSVLRHDTALAEKNLTKDKELPNEAIPHQLATVVIDNSDFKEETENQTHIKSMILLQNPAFQMDRSPHSPMKRSLKKAIPAPDIRIEDYSLTKKYLLALPNSKMNYQMFLWPITNVLAYKIWYTLW